MTAPALSRELVPELGPSLGRLTDPPSGRPRGALGVVLDDIRLQLVTGVFELAGAARSFALAGDRDGAISSLSRVAWLDLWEKAAAAAAGRITEVVNARFREAAAESRFSRRRLEALLLTADDTRAVEARIGSGGAPFVAALEQVEQATNAVTARGGDPRTQTAWQDALTGAARRLESAWLALESATEAEQSRWRGEIERVRAWRRPRWPLWILTLAMLAGATWLGLILGGYLPVPPPLRPLADYWWSRP